MVAVEVEVGVVRELLLLGAAGCWGACAGEDGCGTGAAWVAGGRRDSWEGSVARRWRGCGLNGAVVTGFDLGTQSNFDRGTLLSIILVRVNGTPPVASGRGASVDCVVAFV